MKYLLQVLFFCIIVNCDSEPYKPNPRSKPINIVLKEQRPKYFYLSKKTRSKVASRESKLDEKVKRLSRLRHKYRKVNFGKVKKETSNVYKAVKRKPEIKFSHKNHYKLSSSVRFHESIHSVYYSKIEGHAVHYPEINIKADIEELIFYSVQDAKTIFSFIKHVRSIEYYWDSLDKTPSYMFREENRIYFIRMRERQLKNYPLSIASMLKG